MSHCRTNDISCCCCIQTQQTLLRPSLKLDLDVVWSQTLVWFSSSRCLILFMTACPIHSCFWCLHLVLICLCTKCCRKLAMHLQFGYLYWTLKTLRLVYCVHWWTDRPWVFWENHKWIHTVERSIWTKPQSFIIVVVTSILMYACRRSWHEWKKNLHLQPFLKHNAQWQVEHSSNLYFSKV